MDRTARKEMLPGGLKAEGVALCGNVVLVQARAVSSTASCPGCGQPSDRADRIPVVLVAREHRPDHPGHLVGQRDGDQHTRFAGQNVGEPRPGFAAITHSPASDPMDAFSLYGDFSSTILAHSMPSGGGIHPINFDPPDDLSDRP